MRVKAPSRPNAYSSPSRSIFPREKTITATGMITEMAMARWGVLKRRLRSASQAGMKPSLTRARNTW